MLSEHGRSGVNKVAPRIAGVFVKAGITPNMITLVGMAATVAAALVLFGNGYLFAGAIVIGLCTLFDLLDGAVARAGGTGSPYGALVDAVSDRIADGAILGALLWYVIHREPDNSIAIVMLLIALTFSQVVSYSKARADAGGLATPGGLMERADRLVIVLVGAGLEGLGVPWMLELGVSIVAIGSVVTVVQRVLGGRASYLKSEPQADGGRPPHEKEQ